MEIKYTKDQRDLINSVQNTMSLIKAFLKIYTDEDLDMVEVLQGAYKSGVCILTTAKLLYGINDDLANEHILKLQDQLFCAADYIEQHDSLNIKVKELINA